MALNYNYSEVSHKGNIRKNNEDAYFSKITPNGHLFVLCDGMGGAAAGEIASRLTVKTIVEFFDAEIHEDIPMAINESILKANTLVHSKAINNKDLMGMGTTVCCLLIKDDVVYISHVGDSRVYLLSDDILYNITRDHSKVSRLIERGILTVEESLTHREKNVILQAIGTEETVQPELCEIPLQLKMTDILLMCSDGLNDMVHEDEIHRIISTKDDELDSKAHNLIQSALDNGGKDNITVQLIEILESPYKESVFMDRSFESKLVQPIDLVKSKNQNLKLYTIIGVLLLFISALGFSVFKLYPRISNKSENIITNESSIIASPILENKENGLLPEKDTEAKTNIDSVLRKDADTKPTLKESEKNDDLDGLLSKPQIIIPKPVVQKSRVGSQIEPNEIDLKNTNIIPSISSDEEVREVITPVYEATERINIGSNNTTDSLKVSSNIKNKLKPITNVVKQLMIKEKIEEKVDKEENQSVVDNEIDIDSTFVGEKIIIDKEDEQPDGKYAKIYTKVSFNEYQKIISDFKKFGWKNQHSFIESILSENNLSTPIKFPLRTIKIKERIKHKQ